eukprot:364234-Chlamydomonas_euryale.AAC.12
MAHWPPPRPCLRLANLWANAMSANLAPGRYIGQPHSNHVLANAHAPLAVGQPHDQCRIGQPSPPTAALANATPTARLANLASNRCFGQYNTQRQVANLVFNRCLGQPESNHVLANVVALLALANDFPTGHPTHSSRPRWTRVGQPTNGAPALANLKFCWLADKWENAALLPMRRCHWPTRGEVLGRWLQIHGVGPALLARAAGKDFTLDEW